MAVARSGVLAISNSIMSRDSSGERNVLIQKEKATVRMRKVNKTHFDFTDRPGERDSIY
jgi:hypothetical protein